MTRTPSRLLQIATFLGLVTIVCNQLRRTCAHDFLPVFFDDESAKVLQVDAPLPRGLKAQLIRRLHDAGARGLIVKFFEDLPRDPDQDRAFAKALCLMPTVLQACLCTDGSTNSLPNRFWVQETNRISFQPPLADVQGYIPLPQFSACARGVGFVDLDLRRPESIPVIEAYQGHLVPAFYLNALELELGARANFASGTNVSFGNRALSFNGVGEHPITRDLPAINYVPFDKVLDGTATNDFRDKVIILGYEGSRIHNINTRWGALPAHRYFVQALLALREDLDQLLPERKPIENTRQ